MTDQEKELVKQMREPLECGHTAEQHAGALMIVMLCRKLSMPFDVMIAACKIIGNKEEGHLTAQPDHSVMPLAHE